MIPAFDKLRDPEIESMFRAPLIACILIAGADGHIDRKEIQKAIHQTKKTAGKSKQLGEFFKMVEVDFEDKLKVLLQSLPVELTERNKLIIAELTSINAILPKLSIEFSREFYSRMRDLAHQVASSSGGMLGLNSVDEHEARYIDLPMLKNPS